jgi:nicotinamidase-related amidase
MQNKMARKIIYVAVMTDLSDSFVDENGAFYCGSTKEHKENAARLTKTVIEHGGMAVFNTDLHPYKSWEFNFNKGPYLPHNMPKKFWEQAYREHPELREKSISPELTQVVQEVVKDLKTGIFVPRHVYFQERDKQELSFIPEDVEDTFGQKIITRDEFMQQDFQYVIAPKKYFDATRLATDKSLGRGVKYSRVPEEDENIFSLLIEKFPEEKYELVFLNPSVVEGICTLMTATGQRQEFPRNEILTPSDGVTSLVGFSFQTSGESREACKRVAGDMGIRYRTTREILGDMTK